MATTTATNAAAGFPVTTPNDGVMAVSYGFAEVTADPSANDTVELCWIPAGAVIVGGTFYADAMDTNGTPALAYKLGTAADDDAFLAAEVFAQNAREERAFYSTANVNLAANATTQKVVLTWTAGAGTFAAGTVAVEVRYVMPVNG